MILKSVEPDFFNALNEWRKLSAEMADGAAFAALSDDCLHSRQTEVLMAASASLRAISEQVRRQASDVRRASQDRVKNLKSA